MDVGLAERWQGARKVCVFDVAVVEIGCGWLTGMADSVLTGYDAPVCEAGGYVVREVADDGGQDGGFGFVDSTHYCEEVDCGFEGAGEETGSGKEEISYRGRLEIEC